MSFLQCFLILIYFYNTLESLQFLAKFIEANFQVILLWKELMRCSDFWTVFFGQAIKALKCIFLFFLFTNS